MSTAVTPPGVELVGPSTEDEQIDMSSFPLDPPTMVRVPSEADRDDLSPESAALGQQFLSACRDGDVAALQGLLRTTDLFSLPAANSAAAAGAQPHSASAKWPTGYFYFEEGLELVLGRDQQLADRAGAADPGWSTAELAKRRMEVFRTLIGEIAGKEEHVKRRALAPFVEQTVNDELPYPRLVARILDRGVLRAVSPEFASQLLYLAIIRNLTSTALVLVQRPETDAGIIDAMFRHSDGLSCLDQALRRRQFELAECLLRRLRVVRGPSAPWLSSSASLSTGGSLLAAAADADAGADQPGPITTESGSDLLTPRQASPGAALSRNGGGSSRARRVAYRQRHKTSIVDYTGASEQSLVVYNLLYANESPASDAGGMTPEPSPFEYIVSKLKRDSVWQGRLLSTPVMVALVQWKWRAFSQSFYRVFFALDVFVIALWFTAVILHHQSGVDRAFSHYDLGTTRDVLRLVAELAIVFLAGQGLIAEYYQWRGSSHTRVSVPEFVPGDLALALGASNSPVRPGAPPTPSFRVRTYWTEAQNSIEVLALSYTVVVAVLRFVAAVGLGQVVSDSTDRAFVFVVGLLVFARLGQLLTIPSGTGPLLRMMPHFGRDLARFFSMFVLVFLAFGLGFLVLFPPASSPFPAASDAFTGLLFASFADFTYLWGYLGALTAESNGGFGRLAVWAYAIVVPLVLITTLFGLFTTSLNRVYEEAEAEWRAGLASFVLDTEWAVGHVEAERRVRELVADREAFAADVESAGASDPLRCVVETVAESELQLAQSNQAELVRRLDELERWQHRSDMEIANVALAVAAAADSSRQAFAVDAARWEQMEQSMGKILGAVQQTRQ